MHADVLDKGTRFRPLKLYTIQLVLAEVAARNELALDPQFKLPKMPYKGGAGPGPLRLPLDALAGPDTEAGAPEAGQRGVVVPGSAPPAPDRPLVREVDPARDRGAVLRLEPTRRSKRPAAGLGPGAGPDAAPAQLRSADAAPQPRAPAPGLHRLTGRVQPVGRPVMAFDVTLTLPPAVADQVRSAPTALRLDVVGQDLRAAAPGCEALTVPLPCFVETGAGARGAVQADGTLLLRLALRPLEDVLRAGTAGAGA